MNLEMKNIAAKVVDAMLQGKMSRLAAAAGVALAAMFLAGCAGQVKDTSRTFSGVVIDAGHGGHDSGATTRYAGREKDAALDVALRLRPKIEAAGFRTVMTRDDDTFIPLDKRAAISNREGNVVFVSIHFNYARRSRVRGSEVYFNARCAAPLARNILDQICSIPGTSHRGIRKASFRVLKKNSYPAVLVECGYLTNPSEGRRCATGMFRERVAQAIFEGLMIQRRGGEVMLAAE
jgi:N-acetylmuramoyl-L-alanine amidase